MLKIQIKDDIVQDVQNIVDGVYAPLTGFLYQNDFQSVLDKMRLSDGQVWGMPIVLDIGEQVAQNITNGEDVVLEDEQGVEVAILKNVEVYSYDKKEYAQKIYGTLDNNHPGVAEIERREDQLVGGKLVVKYVRPRIFATHNLTPAKTKDIFCKRGWKTIVAFQTRNVPHRGHEFLQKYALNQVDGLLVQPVVGEKKLDDFKDEYILSSYEILLDKYFDENKALLGALPLKMRYAGPREALMHALIRRNYGCTHFIVGRDHAGVGDYYSPTAAQEIFDNFTKDELGIEILKYGEVVYNEKKDKYCFAKDCAPEDKKSFSGTVLRKSIKERKDPPLYLVRQEVYDLLINSDNSLVDGMYKEKHNKKGFVLWFTGLSAAGKSTIADAVYKVLEQREMKLERLDGDVVRENLTKDLGFSREDRDENIRRIGFVANLLSKNDVGVIASFIAPYEKQRSELRAKVHNFIEVFVDAPLEVCEARDPKGMYKKARSGEIKMFTGVSDPYEVPEKPDIHLKSSEDSIEKCVEYVIQFLQSKKYI